MSPCVTGGRDPLRIERLKADRNKPLCRSINCPLWIGLVGECQPLLGECRIIDRRSGWHQAKQGPTDPEYPLARAVVVRVIGEEHHALLGCLPQLGWASHLPTESVLDRPKLGLFFF